jgi:hypothetical protein
MRPRSGWIVQLTDHDEGVSPEQLGCLIQEVQDQSDQTSGHAEQVPSRPPAQRQPSVEISDQEGSGASVESQATGTPEPEGGG